LEEDRVFQEQKQRRAAVEAFEASQRAAAAASVVARPRPKPHVVKEKPKKVPAKDGDWTVASRNMKASVVKPVVTPSAWNVPKSTVFKPPTEAGLKVFIGGVSFEDIVKRGSQEQWNDARLSVVKSGRIEELKNMVAAFGKIKKWQEAWDEGYAFATFAKPEDAERALRTLSQFVNRKGLCKQIRARLISQTKEKLMAPSPSFYIRWPAFYQKIVDRNAEKKGVERAAKQAAKEEQDRLDKVERLTAAAGSA